MLQLVEIVVDCGDRKVEEPVGAPGKFIATVVVQVLTDTHQGSQQVRAEVDSLAKESKYLLS